MEIGWILCLSMWFWLVVISCEVFEVTGEGILMSVVFLGSFYCHYVWLFHYYVRGYELGGSVYRWPSPLEAVTLVLNVSFTLVSFLEIVRRAFGLRTQLLPPWAALAYLLFIFTRFAFHKAWKDTLLLDLEPKQQCQEEKSSQLIINTQV